MRLPGLLSRPVDALPGLAGTARVGRSPDRSALGVGAQELGGPILGAGAKRHGDDPVVRLLRRVRAGDVVVIDAPDLDRETADALVRAQPVAVVNRSPSMSGRYPNPGPMILVAAGIELIDVPGARLGKSVRDGTVIRVHEGSVYVGERLLAQGTRWDPSGIAQAMAEARNTLIAHLEAFSGNLIELIHSESALLFDGSGVPEVAVHLAGRHVVVVADGPGHTAELKKLSSFIREFHPVLVGVDRGADSLIRAGHTPDLIVGDPDLISGSALRCGAEVVLPAAPDGHAPGLTRLQDLGIGAVTFPAVGSPMDLALLLSHHHGATLIVTAGSRITLDNLLHHRGQQTAPAAFLTRLRVGARVVEADAIATMYRTRISSTVAMLLLAAALVAVIVAVVASNTGAELLDWGAHWWHHTGSPWWSHQLTHVERLIP